MDSEGTLGPAYEVCLAAICDICESCSTCRIASRASGFGTPPIPADACADCRLRVCGRGSRRGRWRKSSGSDQICNQGPIRGLVRESQPWPGRPNRTHALESLQNRGPTRLQQSQRFSHRPATHSPLCTKSEIRDLPANQSTNLAPAPPNGPGQGLMSSRIMAESRDPALPPGTDIHDFPWTGFDIKNQSANQSTNPSLGPGLPDQACTGASSKTPEPQDSR